MAQPMARPVMRCDHVHVLCVQMGPWLAVEIPSLIAGGKIKHKEAAGSS